MNSKTRHFCLCENKAASCWDCYLFAAAEPQVLALWVRASPGKKQQSSLRNINTAAHLDRCSLGSGCEKGQNGSPYWGFLMIMYLETNVCPIRAVCVVLLTAHEHVPEIQERCKRMKTVCVMFLLFCQHTIAERGDLLVTLTCAVCCIALEVCKKFHRQSCFCIYTFVSKMVITNSCSTRKSQSKGYQKPLVNGFTLHFRCTCGGSSAELFRFFQLAPAVAILFPICLFPVNLIITCSIACALGCHQTYQGTLTRPNKSFFFFTAALSIRYICPYTSVFHRILSDP